MFVHNFGDLSRRNQPTKANGVSNKIDWWDGFHLAPKVTNERDLESCKDTTHGRPQGPGSNLLGKTLFPRRCDLNLGDLIEQIIQLT